MIKFLNPRNPDWTGWTSLSKRSNLILGIALLCVCCSYAQDQIRFEFQAPKMGTTFRLVFYHSDSTVAKDLANQAIAYIDSMNLIFSNYDPTSEISQLIGIKKKWTAISNPLWEVLAISKRVWQNTQGAFDVTVGPLSQLWRRAFKRQEFPKEKSIEEAKGTVGFNYLKFKKRKKAVKFQKGKMKLDFGGIAKGYTADCLGALFRQNGVDCFLIDAGGDLTLGDPPTSKCGWEVRFPDGSLRYLSNKSIATSGDRYHYLEWKGKRYAHIIDPRTGMGITSQQTVSVIASSGTLADAYASAFVVIGKQKSTRIVKKETIQAFFYNKK